MNIGKYIYGFLSVAALASCANMGQPDGGLYDQAPPKILSTTPADKSANAKSIKKVTIAFDEYVKLDNATEKVIVSPPQLEQPDIKTEGKKVVVELKDSLKPNTTYTIDFSDAIQDNNEGNPLGNYTYSFSTGASIDTFEVSGKVLEAQNLEPLKGILVGLYNDTSDTAFTKKPLMRVSRTDSRGHFVIKGIAPGKYRAYALKDADGNYMFNQKSEEIAFNHEIFSPSAMPAIKQDTIWRDSLHIDSIKNVPYTRFMPDDLVLTAFVEEPTDHYLVKSERKDYNKFSFYFSSPSKELPKVKGLNFNEKGAFVLESSIKKDTLTYWIKDTTLCNQDTLEMTVQYMGTDTTGILVDKTDTLQMISKVSYQKRLKDKTKAFEKWKKTQDKAKDKGEAYETEMPKEMLEPKYNVPSTMTPEENVTIEMPVPLVKCDTAAIHLYSKQDTLWYKSPFEFKQLKGSTRTYVLRGEWRPDVEYSLEVDSAAFEDIYGHVSKSMKQGIKIGALDTYGSLFVTLTDLPDTGAVVQLLDKSDNVLKSVRAQGGKADFYYLSEGTYYLRLFVDSNGNGVWDTGLYAEDRQPEAVYYYHEAIDVKAKWDVPRTWTVKARNLADQKPVEITKQKADKEKKRVDRNAERAKKLGLTNTQNVK